MTDEHQRDAEIGRALEVLARPHPPVDHVANVLAASGPSARDEPWVTRHDVLGGHGWWRPRWVVPLAASVTLSIAAWWQAAPTPPSWPTSEATGTSSAAWGTLRDVERPVLPPQMYWAMDPFAEFATLRPAARLVARTAPAGSASLFGSGSAASAGVPHTVAQSIDDEHVPAGAPAPSSLPEITLAAIVPIPVTMPPLPRPAAIELAEITMAPITLGRIDSCALPEEENP